MSCSCCNKPKLAVQLYSIHQYVEKEGLAKAIEAAAKIGYKGVELAGYWGHSAAEIKSFLDANGIVACGTHINRDAFIGDKLKESCEFSMGCGNDLLVCPGGGMGVPQDWDKSIDDWYKYLTEFYAEAGAIAGTFGCKLGIHNHASEFTTILSNGQCMWDYFFSNTPDYVCMEQDVGWTTYAGEDPIERYIKFPHRSPTLHAKENGMRTEGFEGIVGQPPAGVKGVEWDRLHPVACADGVKWYVVECEGRFDLLDAITKSYAFLSKY